MVVLRSKQNECLYGITVLDIYGRHQCFCLIIRPPKMYLAEKRDKCIISTKILFCTKHIINLLTEDLSYQNLFGEISRYLVFATLFKVAPHDKFLSYLVDLNFITNEQILSCWFFNSFRLPER